MSCVKLTKENIIQNVDNLDITNFYLDYSNDDPSCIELDGNDLFFSLGYLEKNKEDATLVVECIVSHYKKNKLLIADELINEKIIQLIANNPNIKEVELKDYCLKETDYLILKDNINKIYCEDVDEKLKYNFDGIIMYNMEKSLISYYNYNELKEKKELSISDGIEISAIPYLNILKDDVKIYIDSTNPYVSEIINFLRNNGKNNQVIINLCSNKEIFNKKVIDKINNYENIMIYITGKYINMKDYVEYENLLYLFVQDAQKLSDFEKYIYAYDIAKKFKKGKENNNDRGKARDIYQILFNNYMVCVGYEELFGDLLEKLGISSIDELSKVNLDTYKAEKQLEKKYGKEIWNSMDNKTQNKLMKEQAAFVPTSFGGHARRICYINDSKYNIDGIYFSDPFWDNDLEKNFYNHLAMTSDEVLNERRTFKFKNDYTELFYVKSVNEFNEKLNILINRLIHGHDESSSFNSIIKLLLNEINILCPKFCETLCSKYDIDMEEPMNIDDIYNIPSNITDFLLELAQFIVDKTHKEISGETIFSAVKNVYANVYENGLTNDELNEMIDYNNEIQEADFESEKFRR